MDDSMNKSQHMPSSAAKSPLQPPHTQFGFDLVVPINLRNREDARAWKLFLQEIVNKWRHKDPAGECFLVEENYMEWDVGEASFNPYIPFDPQYFRQFGRTIAAEDRVEQSDLIHQHVWSVARRHLGNRVRRSNADTRDAQTLSPESLEGLRDTVYALGPLDDNSPDELWMWQLYEAGEAAALLPRRSTSTFRPLAPQPPLLSTNASVATEPIARYDSVNEPDGGESMMDYPHPGMATSNRSSIVPPVSHLGYALPPNSFGLFPITATVTPTIPTATTERDVIDSPATPQHELSLAQARFSDMLQQAPLLLFLEGTPDQPEDDTNVTDFVVAQLRGMKAKWGHVNVLEAEDIRQLVVKTSGSEEFPQLRAGVEFLHGIELVAVLTSPEFLRKYGKT